MRAFCMDGNAYRLLGCTLDTPKKAVLDVLKDYQKELAKASPEELYPSRECVQRKLNVVSSFLNDREMRCVYLGFLASERIRVPIPDYEVTTARFVASVLIALATRPVPWGKGFPLRTVAGGFAWVDGKTLCAPQSASSPIPPSPSFSIRR